MLCRLMGRRGAVFSIRPHFCFKTNTLIFMFLLPFYKYLENYRFFFFLLLGTQLPYVALSIRPVTHMQAGNPYGLLGNPTPT